MTSKERFFSGSPTEAPVIFLIFGDPQRGHRIFFFKIFLFDDFCLIVFISALIIYTAHVKICLRGLNIFYQASYIYCEVAERRSCYGRYGFVKEKNIAAS